jgi:hypothetical protein
MDRPPMRWVLAGFRADVREWLLVLREVTAEDIATALDPLRGHPRADTFVALR